MQFGYFTLSDNRYPNNPRSAEDFIKDIYAEALWAEKIGLNSAWIGEHHFNLLGVNASPLAILAQLAGATTRLRLAPASWARMASGEALTPRRLKWCSPIQAELRPTVSAHNASA